MQYGTYVGGDGDDTTDGDGLAGWNDLVEVVAVGITTTSSNLPTRRGVAQATYGGDGATGCGSGDAWIAVIRPTSSGDSSLVSATYLGGAAGEHVGGVSAISGGRALVGVVGRTSSTDFPATRGARTTWNGPTCENVSGTADAFVALVDIDTGAHAATYLGGTDLDRGAAISAVTVAGVTSSPDFPTVGPVDPTYDGGSDGFLTAFGSPAPVTGGDPGRDAIVGDAGSEEMAADGCCGAAPGAAGTTGLLAGLVMLLVRRRRGR
jgi:hypothetical protein